jgi:uncharacterized membrane protein
LSDRDLERLLGRWRAADLIDDASAARIRDWEARQPARPREDGLVRYAFGFGGLLLAAGLLLFVAANWPQMSPAARVLLLAATVGMLHVGAAVARQRLPALATTLHAVGTGALGAGIFLSGQVFNLAEHWPEGLLLWTLGALAAAVLLRDWPQAVWLALLAPAWLVGQWFASDATDATPVAAGVLLLCLAYVAAVDVRRDSSWRRAVALLGAIVAVPAAILLPHDMFFGRGPVAPEAGWRAVAWVAAIGVPLLAGAWLRGGRAAWPLLPAAAVVVVIATLDADDRGQLLLLHILYAALAAGLVWWGVRDRHRLRVNLGVLAFALNVLAFYYGSVFDKLGRSLGLIGLGVLFVAGGWALERVRRRLLARTEAQA